MYSWIEDLGYSQQLERAQGNDSSQVEDLKFCLKTPSSLDLTTELALDCFQVVLAELKDLKRGKVIGCLTSTKLIAY